MMMRCFSLCGFALLLFAWPVAAQGKKAGDDRLPITKLAAAKILPEQCVLKYRVTTSSPLCQEFFDQGLGYFYSYVWMEAARSFETAAKHDPDCAMAWWGLSRAIEKWGKGQHTGALKKAQDLLPKTSHRESMLITARLQEKGMTTGITPEKRKSSALRTLDELLAMFDDDEEGWFNRAMLEDAPVARVPYFKALLRVNPLHPGAHHELVHFYENFKRPALGWPHAELYIKSSPGIPHAFHMQAHLGMRIGRWDKTTDYSARAVELQVAYHQAMSVKPSEDWQFTHHLEILTMSLTHDGRFQEANKIKKLSQASKYEHRMPWFRLHLAERNWDEALKIAAGDGKKDKVGASYLRALVYLKKGDFDRAESEVEILQEAFQHKRTDKELEMHLWETQGFLQAARGQGEVGLKLLAKAVDRNKNSFKHHAWGQGAYLMEVWGCGALLAGNLDVAEEAFLEALAHDVGSVRGALGMQVVCERQNRTEEALRFAELAQKCWRRADAGCLQMELGSMRGMLPSLSKQ